MQAHLAANLLFAALLVRPSGNPGVRRGRRWFLSRSFCIIQVHACTVRDPMDCGVGIPGADQRRYLLPLLVGYHSGGGAWDWMAVFSHRDRFEWPWFGGSERRPLPACLRGQKISCRSNNRTAALVKMCVWATPFAVVALALLGCVISALGLAHVRRLAYSANPDFRGLYLRQVRSRSWVGVSIFSLRMGCNSNFGRLRDVRNRTESIDASSHSPALQPS